MTTLYQRSKTGKTKILHLWTSGPFLYTKWGLIGSKLQESSKECTPKNTGKTNETTAEQQAVEELKHKVNKKTKEGYTKNINESNERSISDISLDNLPVYFCPSKPKKECPKKIIGKTYGQIKRNGHCIPLVKTESGKVKKYSRRMKEITEYVKYVPEFEDITSKMENGTLVMTEFCVTGKDGIDRPRLSSEITRKEDADKVKKARENILKNNKIEVIPFDIMFYRNKFVGNIDYMERYKILQGLKLPNIPEIYKDWQKYVGQHKEQGKEGWILRIQGEDSHISYSLSGKEDRCGCWKYVYTRNDDFIVTSASKGLAGKHTGLYCKFDISQYVDGTLTSCGKCGPGKLNHKRLAELTREIDSGETKFPFVIMIEYRTRQPDTLKLEFPQLVRVRYDKNPEECTI